MTGVSRLLPSEPSLQGPSAPVRSLAAAKCGRLFDGFLRMQQDSHTSSQSTPIQISHSAPHIQTTDASISPRRMFATIARRAAQGAKPSSSAEYIRKIRELYPPKKVWPPDFKRLSPQEQFKFEKKFKRRLALASERPRWVKFVKLVQLFTVTCMLSWTLG